MSENAKPRTDLHIKGVNYLPHEATARKIAGPIMDRFEPNDKGIIVANEAVLGELMVGAAYEGYISGLARGLATQTGLEGALELYLSGTNAGIQIGMEIERKKHDGNGS